MKLYIGIMSGTSMDGIDAVLVSFDAKRINIIGAYTQDFPGALKDDLFQFLNTRQSTLPKLGEVDHRLALCYAEAVAGLLKKTGVKAEEIEAIGCHGQTVFHEPSSPFPFTMQLGDGNLLAAKTGIKTVADFRRMDMAFGGEGAPLVPAFHQDFFFSRSERRVILNLGGIANLTLLAEDEAKVLGFDTGPANCLMDSWIYHVKHEKFDKDGKWAASGTVRAELLDEMLSEPYFEQAVPKSTGRELFNLEWLNERTLKIGTMREEDVQATLLELTAFSVARAIKQYAPGTDAVYVCGGGAYNCYLLERLAVNLKGVKVATTEKLGVAPQQVEALAFAWLAMQRVNNLPGNLPSVTGATQKVLLGVIHEPGERYRPNIAGKVNTINPYFSKQATAPKT